jgi:hypothetical protein
VATVVVSVLLAIAVTGGVLRTKVLKIVPGIAIWSVAMAMQTNTPTIREWVFLSVVSGIKIFNYFKITFRADYIFHK